MMVMTMTMVKVTMIELFWPLMMVTIMMTMTMVKVTMTNKFWPLMMVTRIMAMTMTMVKVTMVKTFSGRCLWYFNEGDDDYDDEDFFCPPAQHCTFRPYA